MIFGTTRWESKRLADTPPNKALHRSRRRAILIILAMPFGGPVNGVFDSLGWCLLLTDCDERFRPASVDM